MARSPLSIIRFRVIFIICWAVIIADNILVLHFFGLPWEAAIIDSSICNTLLLLVSLLVMNTLRYYLPRGQQYINIFSICLFLTIAWLLLVKWLLKVSLDHYPGYSDILHHSLSIRFSIAFLQVTQRMQCGTGRLMCESKAEPVLNGILSLIR